MQLPKIKIKYGLKTVLAIIAMLVFAIEIYFGYVFLYKNMTTGQILEQTDKIVRVDNAAYKAAIDYITSLKVFVPDSADPSKNPFK